MTVVEVSSLDFRYKTIIIEVVSPSKNQKKE
jgi:hypothetical protein